MYGKNGAISRTVRPVLLERPWGRVDVQALPPRSWCSRCGAEVYRVGRQLCSRCEKG